MTEQNPGSKYENIENSEIIKGYNALSEAIQSKTLVASYSAYMSAAAHFLEAQCAVGLLAIILNSPHSQPGIVDLLKQMEN